MRASAWVAIAAFLGIYVALSRPLNSFLGEVVRMAALSESTPPWLPIIVPAVVLGGTAGLVFGLVIRWGQHYELSLEP